MSKEELVSIGKRLRQVRTHLGIKQNAMADALGISGAHLSEIETGKSTPSGEIFLKIAKIYKISLDYLFLERGDMLYSPGSTESHNFDHDINSIEKLAWMMNESDYFKSSILTAAQRVMLEQSEIVKKSVTLKKGKPT